jgi:FkbM family methyltransferase
MITRRIQEYMDRPDVRRHRGRYLARRMSYELERLLLPRRLGVEREVDFDDGLRVGVRLAEAIDRSIYLYGFYEYRTAMAYCSFIRPGATVADIGAHVGQFTLLAAHRVGAGGLVLSFEPNPENRARLIKNVNRNALANVRVLEYAVSDRGGSATLQIPQVEHSSGEGSLHARGPVQKEFAIETRSLDVVLEELHIERIDVMKVDVEGLEAEVFRGGAQTLRKSRPTIVFEVNDVYQRDSGFSAPAIDVLRELGYRFYGIGVASPGTVNLIPLADGADPRPYREPWYALNLVAVHEEGPVSPHA